MVQPVSFQSKLRSWLLIFREYTKGNFNNADALLKRHAELCETYQRWRGSTITSATVLDLGCGQLAAQAALFAGAGANTTAVDIELPSYRLSIRQLFRIWRANGPERAAKSVVRHFLFDRPFVARLRSTGDHIPCWEKVRFRRMNASALDFDSESFDFVYSDWAFEHIADVAGALSAVRRVLRPGGIFTGRIHLFPSLSGGHNLEWHYPDVKMQRRSEPWDHLRSNQFPVNVYVNRLRLEDYRRLLTARLTVQSERITYEGETFLTPLIEAELANRGYGHDDLLATVLDVVATRSG